MREHVADAVDVRLEGLGQTLEGRQPAAPRPTDPAVHQQQYRHMVVATPRQDVAQAFLQSPGTRSLQARVPQPVQIDLALVPVAGVLEPVIARALERGLIDDLGPTHRVERLVGELDAWGRCSRTPAM